MCILENTKYLLLRYYYYLLNSSNNFKITKSRSNNSNILILHEYK